MTEDEIKANAVMDFVDSMIAAFNDGYVDRNHCRLSELYMAATEHVKHAYGIENPDIAERYGKTVAKDIGLHTESK